MRLVRLGFVVGFTLVALLGPTASAQEAPTGFAQTAFYDRVGSDGVADHADPQGLIKTPWNFHRQQEQADAFASMDLTAAAQRISIPQSGTGYGDAHINQKFPADAGEAYAASATVSFSEVRNAQMFWGRLVVVPLAADGSQVGGIAGECNSEVNPSKDVDPGGNEVPVVVLEVANCIFPNSTAVKEVIVKVGAKNQLIYQGAEKIKGSGQMLIREVTFHKVTDTSLPR